MTERVRISESTLHKFVGPFPDIPVFAHVDTELLYQGDPEPFHINLPVVEKRVSDNGLVYDDQLLDTIAEQLQQGIGGIRGHIPDGAESTAFPIEEVFWIGTVKEQGKLWAKGYIPPSELREFVRIKKAQNGRIRTSIYGSAVRETANGQSGRWRAKDFELEQLDLAPPKRASLKIGDGKFLITREMATEDDMPEITINDVPAQVREQIIAQAQGNVNAQRVKELETANTELQTQVSELATFKTIVAEIRANIGKDTDTVQIVTEYHTMANKLAELLGVPYTNITVKVEEMHEQVAEMRKSAFDRVVDDQIAELTNWNPRDDAGKQRVASFRKTLRRATLTELGDKRDEAAVKETVTKLWDEEYEVLGEAVVRELAGPGAVVAPTRQKPTGGLNLDDGWEDAIRDEFGVGRKK